MNIAHRNNGFLIISQVYVPDPASVGQHIHDLAVNLVSRGIPVTILTAIRGYDDPRFLYKEKETIQGVRIIRLHASSFGKANIPIRLAGQFSFLIQCILYGLFAKRMGSIVVSTSPPMASIAALTIRLFRNVRIHLWVMDINPDQTVALGKASDGDLTVRVFHFLNRRILRRSDSVIALDRFMANRIKAKLDVTAKLHVIPPWPHVQPGRTILHKENPFRDAHGMNGKFVFMYSGNMSIGSPLTTILDAALMLQDRPDIQFVFIGGGVGRQEVVEAMKKTHIGNIQCLPYQKLSEIQYSLSAADVHLVTLGESMVGIIHPCKIYGAMAVGRPILFVGPAPSHISDILKKYQIGWQVLHGDIKGMVNTVVKIASFDPMKLEERGNLARKVIACNYSKDILCNELSNLLTAT
jgi:colanic acid biosynthesis glycosyl transferase WcaI